MVRPGVIPHMGGTAIAPQLVEMARQVPAGQAIVEVGSWLGAGTVALAQGARDAGVSLHVYDIWKANASQVEKAAAFGLRLRPHEDLLPHVRRAVDPLGADVTYHRGNVKGARWGGQPIGLYVDDASKQKPTWTHVAQTFLPALADGALVVLMDYFWCQAKGHPYLSQNRYMAGRPDHFTLVAGPLGDTSTAVFRYAA